jgi:hypothetical protein
VVDGQGAREVGEEDDRGLQRRYEDRLTARVVPGDAGTQLFDACVDVLGREVDLADPRIGD